MNLPLNTTGCLSHDFGATRTIVARRGRICIFMRHSAIGACHTKRQIQWISLLVRRATCHINLVRQVPVAPRCNRTETLTSWENTSVMRIGVGLLLDLDGLCCMWSEFTFTVCHRRFPLPFAVAGDDSKAVFGLIKGEKKSCFWFVNKGNLGRIPCIWLMLIGKSLKG